MSETLSDAIRVEAVVYFLADPRTPRHPRYVGSTKDAVARERQHAKRFQSCNADVRAWKESLAAAGLAPLLVVVSTHETRRAAQDAEWRLLHRWRRRGLADLNGARDGNMEAFALEWTAKRSRRAA